ncbi:MAG TPA: TlpA disulfide reductase family protein [Gemmataceae bacterium]|nr:TlpA disulfide reductase family protein [Gemmataceae bacterium]
MRVLAAMIVAACALAAGCTSLASRTRDRDRDRDRDRLPARDRDPDRPWWLDGAETAGRGKGKNKVLPDDARADRDSIIAGEVIDADEGRRLRGKTYVIVRPVDEVAPAGARGNVGFETDEDGYFFMPGLVPGRTYLLSAVREVDGRRIAAEVQVKPPAGNIRLELGANKVSSVTPPLPPLPSVGPFEPRAATPSPAPPPAADRGWEPGAAPPGTTTPAPPAEPPLPLRKENIAGNPHRPPTAAISPPDTAAPPPPRPAADPPQTRLPGQRVPNFVVSDVLGADWDLRSARGQLILMDFWSTTCVPCQRAMPAMKRLQADYGASGLEIVALACEADAPFSVRARDADDMARAKELNYRVYLERDGRVREVQRLFNVQWVPTLVLLDRQGTIVWRGGATDTDLAAVEELIKSRLMRR